MQSYMNDLQGLLSEIENYENIVEEYAALQKQLISEGGKNSNC